MKTSEASRFKALICFIVSITFYDRLFCQRNERTGITHSSVEGNHCPANSCSRFLGELLQFADKYWPFAKGSARNQIANSTPSCILAVEKLWLLFLFLTSLKTQEASQDPVAQGQTFSWPPLLFRWIDFAPDLPVSLGKLSRSGEVVSAPLRTVGEGA